MALALALNPKTLPTYDAPLAFAESAVVRLGFPQQPWSSCDPRTAASVLRACVANYTRACAVVGPLGWGGHRGRTYRHLASTFPRVVDRELHCDVADVGCDVAVLWILVQVASASASSALGAEDRLKVMTLLGVSADRSSPFTVPAPFWSNRDEFMQAADTLARLQCYLCDAWRTQPDRRPSADEVARNMELVLHATRDLRTVLGGLGAFTGNLPLDMGPTMPAKYDAPFSKATNNGNNYANRFSFRYDAWQEEMICNDTISVTTTGEGQLPHSHPPERTYPHFSIVHLATTSFPIPEADEDKCIRGSEDATLEEILKVLSRLRPRPFNLQFPASSAW